MAEALKCGRGPPLVLDDDRMLKSMRGHTQARPRKSLALEESLPTGSNPRFLREEADEAGALIAVIVLGEFFRVFCARLVCFLLESRLPDPPKKTDGFFLFGWSDRQTNRQTNRHMPSGPRQTKFLLVWFSSRMSSVLASHVDW